MPNSVACVVVTNVSPVYANLFSLSARVPILTVAAMIAFASNSLLCRAALKQTSIDPASFTFVRVFSGAVVLWFVMNLRRMIRTTRSGGVGGNWISALALLVYAAGFSFAYCSCRSSDWRATALRRRAGNDDPLEFAQRRRFARNSNSWPNRSNDRICRAFVSRTFRSALTRFNSDARSRRCLGCLFVAQQEREKCCDCNH